MNLYYISFFDSISSEGSIKWEKFFNTFGHLAVADVLKMSSRFHYYKIYSVFVILNPHPTVIIQNWKVTDIINTDMNTAAQTMLTNF